MAARRGVGERMERRGVNVRLGSAYCVRPIHWHQPIYILLD